MKKDERKRNVILAVIGLIAGFYVQSSILSPSGGPVPALVPVVVAAVDISPGATLRSEILKVFQWPEGILPPNTVKLKKEVEGLVITVPVNKGEPILLPKLVRHVRRPVS